MLTMGTYRRLYYALGTTLVIGSLGPWFTDPITYSGTSQGGVIVVIGAVLIVGLVSTAAFTASKLWLLGILAAACLCVIVSGGALVRFLVDGEDFLAVQIGWGLGLTVVAAFSLVVLSIVHYFHMASGSGGWPAGFGLVGGTVFVIAAGLGGVAMIEGDGQDLAEEITAKKRSSDRDYQAIRLSRAASDDLTWSIAVYGNRRGEICWFSLKVFDAGETMDSQLRNREIQHCGAEIPPRSWELIGEGPERISRTVKWTLVFLTRRDVGYLNVLAGTKNLFQKEDSGSER